MADALALRRPAGSRPAIIVGVLLGVFFAVTLAALPGNWAFYVCAAALLASALPIVARFRLDAESLVSFLYVFALQFFLSFNLVYESNPLPGGTQGINISLELLLALSLWCIWGVARLRGRAAAPWPYRRDFLVGCGAFVLVAALSLANARSVQYGQWGLFYVVTMVAIALTAARLCSTRRGIEALWNAAFALLVTQGIILLLQKALGVTYAMNGDALPNRFADGQRFGGTVGIAPANAATLLMVFLFFAERRLLAKGRKDAWRTMAIFGLGSLCLLLSLTRSCWIGFTGGSMYLVLRALREGTVRPRRLVALAGVALVALVVVWGPVHERLGANHEGAAEERFQLNSIDLEMIRAHPVLGVGINNAYCSIVDYVPWWFGRWDWVYLAHNQYLHVAAETGLPGLAAFVWLLWVTLRALLRSRRTGDPLLEDTVTALLAGVGSMMWGMYLDFYSGMQMYVLLWFTLGASTGVASLCTRERAR